VGQGVDPFQDLKVGPDAAALPDGIAEQLRAVEIGANWGESRWQGWSGEP
jgi:hypothetical protein